MIIISAETGESTGRFYLFLFFSLLPV